MSAVVSAPLFRPNDQRWKQINAEQEAETIARHRAMTVAERLDLGLDLSRFAAELRRSAWEARYGRPDA
ncbi:MAG TPA: hypothetical protein VHW67_11795 [Solirubrobacteraceae bacterium]|nr:hypothetical protein [Solirubrobacteraceae bacterium]